MLRPSCTRRLIRRNYVDPVIPDRVAAMRRVLSDMQRAIDDAKAAHAGLVGGEAGVRVWGYAEVNRVRERGGEWRRGAVARALAALSRLSWHGCYGS